MSWDTIVISDLHLLSKKTLAQKLLQFLKSIKTVKCLILLGDIIDFWRYQLNKLDKESQQLHLSIIEYLLKLAKKGVQIHYVLGNHDEIVWQFIGENLTFGNVSFYDHLILSYPNTKILLIHGHQFDLIIRSAKWLAKIGDRGYHFLIWLNKIYNYGRRKLGFKYWSLSKYVKVKVKTVSNIVGSFEQACVTRCKELQCQIVIAGHIHSPISKKIDGIRYINTGCWTDESNCYFVHIKHDGNCELIQYT